MLHSVADCQPLVPLYDSPVSRCDTDPDPENRVPGQWQALTHWVQMAETPPRWVFPPFPGWFSPAEVALMAGRVTPTMQFDSFAAAADRAIATARGVAA